MQMHYLDQKPDASGGLVGNVVPEGELADGARLFPHRASKMSFIAFQSHWCCFQIDKMP